MISNKSDLFLILAFVKDVFPSKILIKNIFYKHPESFVEIFTGDFIPDDFKMSEKEAIKNIRISIKNINCQQIKEKLNKKNIQFVSFCDDNYPKTLKNIDDPPFVLFYKGNIALLGNLSKVAIVGTRQATNYGKNFCFKFSSMLSERDVIIVSGLASGIDTYAHKGALKNGKTIAVFGTGIDNIFPAENKTLFEEMLQNNNLVVSEYPPGIEGMPWNFPQRNRIISGLSSAVVVVEGDLQSGALITARFAIKQDKPLFAIPGPIDSPASNGPNILIKSGVAELLTSVNDVLERIGVDKQVNLDFSSVENPMEELSEVQKNIFKLLLTKPVSFDLLHQELNLNVSELVRELSILELKGFIEKTLTSEYIKKDSYI